MSDKNIKCNCPNSAQEITKLKKWLVDDCKISEESLNTTSAVDVVIHIVTVLMTEKMLKIATDDLPDHITLDMSQVGHIINGSLDITSKTGEQAFIQSMELTQASANQGPVINTGGPQIVPVIVLRLKWMRGDIEVAPTNSKLILS